LTYNAAAAANVAVLYSPAQASMLYQTGQKSINHTGFDNTSFNYRKLSNTQVLTSGYANVVIAAAVGSGSETYYYTGTLSSSQKDDFVVIPTSNGYSTSKTGTVAISSTNTNVIGTSTSFFTEYSIGDTIYTNSSYRTITSITNNTLMDVDSPFGATTSGLTHQKAWIIGDPISFVNNPNRTIVVSGNTATFNLNEAANAAFNVQIAYTINRSDTTSVKKVLNDTVYVKIDCSNNVSGVKGPYSLGVPDVYKLVGVYADTSGSKTYSTANPDYKSYFTLDNGQRDTHYGLARLTANGNQLAGRLNTSTTLLVELLETLHRVLASLTLIHILSTT
jgi:hypothetical protein